jgi:peptide/nickel transport system ATP-binding protein
MEDRSTLLEVKDLVTEFRTEDQRIRAVDGISFTLHRGETIGIVGESGSGKSVTSLSAMRLIPTPPGRISNGSIHFHPHEIESADLLRLDERDMRRYRGNELGMIFQEPMTSLNPVFTCGDQVVEALKVHRKVMRNANREARERTIQLFEEVRLPRPELIFDSYPHQLSGGQKQRVMIAMAMSCQPSLLIADEPTTALDVTVQKRILELMSDLQMQHDMGILFITHDLGVIAELADRVLVMYQGRIVEEGNVLDIFSNPQHPYTKGLLACRPPLDRRLHWLPTVSHFMTGDSEEGMVSTRNSVEDIVGDLEVSPEERKERQDRIYAQDPMLRIEGLRTWFPVKQGIWGKVRDHIKAVDDVSFNVYPGETLGLVGESGCGKTTLGRTILRLLDPTEGRILYDGRDISGFTQKEMRRVRKDIQIIFQDPYSSLNPRLTIGEAIMEPMRVHGIHSSEKERRERVDEILERVNLDPSQYNRYPHEFSGGQRQRICIARAIAVNPRFIVCDESVSALDVSIQAQVLNLLNELRDSFGLTYLFISHDLSVVKYMSDRMVVMKDGRIEEMGDADSIYRNPQREYTRELIDAIPKGEIDDIKASMARKKQLRGERVSS